ncbi:low molecular weight protein-tyrosine-phosphatase [Aliiroseovarius sp. F47248L]|uniref:low molecular weight protein-tyrosine-phosphatase n=1 Tax=Aliiroseovarius sp. F47248L TaxID=2926420 RepID=UPI001FF20719|nr:low molecular weight protein-tyrosine-phosphatase [Aliiroseovarius sp. F47248L]MCK0139654.1 low molecular weight phosphotyrosine protein phosphatase [Aliiroseovarius sp. F47248L]
MTYRILFVCLGNICRSPTAEAVLRAIASDHPTLKVHIDSAGTSDWHIGEPPYGPMQDAAQTRGYDLSRLRARQFVVEDFDRFDLIVPMDESNLANVERLRPNRSTTRVELFTEFARDTGMDHVPDPYYTRNFDETLDLVEAASRGLVAELMR